MKEEADKLTLEVGVGLDDLSEVLHREVVDVITGSEVGWNPGNLASDGTGEALRQGVVGDNVVLDLSQKGRGGGLNVHGRHCEDVGVLEKWVSVWIQGKKFSMEDKNDKGTKVEVRWLLNKCGVAWYLWWGMRVCVGVVCLGEGPLMES